MAMEKKQKKWLAAAGVTAFLLGTALVGWFAGRPLLAFVSEPERFRGWVESNGVWARLAFVGMVILQVVVAVLPGEPLEIGAGYAFGAVEGTLLCIAGMTLGGLLVFCLVRRFGVRAAEWFLPGEKLEVPRFLRDPKRTALLTAAVFLLPGTPKDVLSYCAGLTPIRLHQWLLITSLCRVPSVLTSTLGGDALGAGRLSLAVWLFAAAICISLAGLALYRCLCRTKEETNHGNHSDS